METKRTSPHEAERKAVSAQAKQKSRERAAMLPNEPRPGDFMVAEQLVAY